MDFDKVDKWEEGGMYESMQNLGPCLGGDWVAASDFDALLAEHKVYRKALEIGHYLEIYASADVESWITQARLEIAEGKNS